MTALKLTICDLALKTLALHPNGLRHKELTDTIVKLRPELKAATVGQICTNLPMTHSDKVSKNGNLFVFQMSDVTPDVGAADQVSEKPPKVRNVEAESPVDEEYNKDIAHSITELKQLLIKMEFYDLKPNIKEKVFEREVFQKLGDRFTKQGKGIRISAFGGMHKPDGLFDGVIALEIKKVSGVGGINHAIHSVLGQSIIYKRNFKAVVVLILDFTGVVLKSLAQGTASEEFRNDLASQDIHLIVKEGIHAKKRKK